MKLILTTTQGIPLITSFLPIESLCTTSMFFCTLQATWFRNNQVKHTHYHKHYTGASSKNDEIQCTEKLAHCCPYYQKQQKYKKPNLSELFQLHWTTVGQVNKPLSLKVDSCIRSTGAGAVTLENQSVSFSRHDGNVKWFKHSIKYQRAWNGGWIHSECCEEPEGFDWGGDQACSHHYKSRKDPQHSFWSRSYWVQSRRGELESVEDLTPCGDIEYCVFLINASLFEEHCNESDKHKFSLDALELRVALLILQCSYKVNKWAWSVPTNFESSGLKSKQLRRSNSTLHTLNNKRWYLNLMCCHCCL